MNEQEDQFYRDQMFRGIFSRLDAQDTKLDKIADQMSDIQGNIKWVYGWAAGVGVIGSSIIEYIKSKLTSNPH